VCVRHVDIEIEIGYRTEENRTEQNIIE
jgi:hypothetical protein